MKGEMHWTGLDRAGFALAAAAVVVVIFAVFLQLHSKTGTWLTARGPIILLKTWLGS